ncbi:MAG TPA: response regulator [Pirellulaceae bacterium]|jgi:two-component system response regulator RegA|nr:response regulator [Pirellulaceae bacterium]
MSDSFSGEAAVGTLMVVDDHDLFRERLARAFRSRGWETLAASNYDEAMEIAGRLNRERRTLDRAVVDQKMPGKSGLELIGDLKELHPQIEVLVLTGFGSISTAVDAVRRGAVNYLPKPADADEILAAFERADQLQPIRASVPEDDASQTPSLAQAEWEHIHRVLTDCNNNISEAARRLGIHRRSLQRKLKKRSP